ncbi:MAG: type II toxin-antitoxin system Phd/YefM family antitoxin [Proteobacteria bacterium]|nr:type II toxin-antitoxin system Phd/YefM family antitoxin [Pseudomonadota bacterium]
MKPRIVNVHEAKTHLSRLLEEVREGHEIIVAKGGKPCARLVPLEQPAERPMGFVKGRVTKAFFEPLPEDEMVGWEPA